MGMSLKIKYIIISVLLILNNSCAQNKNSQIMEDKNTIEKNESKETTYKKLTPEEERVIVHKGTEWPGKGIYTNHKEEGVYTCKRCGTSLYRSSDKFDSHCGWPSFDDEIKGAVERIPDADGQRIEIVCANCKGHLGHVFNGEGFTAKNTRHCVNSISMDFIPANKIVKTDTAIFASGCFWGTEYFLQKAKGVLKTEVGYTGGRKAKPTYHEVSSGSTGHAEAVRVTFDPSQTNYETLAKLFFETHDPTQVDGQGPDIGEQYRSAIFYNNEEQKKVSENLIKLLEAKGYKVATQLVPASEFYIGEEYHRDYYKKSGKTPYCHRYEKKF